MSHHEHGLAILGHPGLLHPESDWNLAFRFPERILTTHDSGEVQDLLAQMESYVDEGKYAVFMLAYEAARAMDECLLVRETGDFPLLWAGVYDAPERDINDFSGDFWAFSDWEHRTGKKEYEAAIHAIKGYLRHGETYQVNYTMALDSFFSGNSLAMYGEVARRMQGTYSMYLDMGRYRVASFSPELFFHCKGRQITAKPMKGTARRGRWDEEDAQKCVALFSTPKERAENVMIVDLLRNDLGRLAEPGSVKVPQLFEVETYPTVLQMTSTVTARLREGVGLGQIFQALYPCGSITGAPKVRTMQIIRELEDSSRRAYCGAMGYASPMGVRMANVPIRTVLIDTNARSTRAHNARFWVGSGVTMDSSSSAEYAECLDKMRFLIDERPDFKLLESLLLHNGRYFLLQRHLKRLARSGGYFRFVFSNAAVRGLLDDIARRNPKGRFKVRLLVDREGEAIAEAHPIDQETSEQLLGKAPGVVCSQDVFLFHKTTNRTVYEQAKARFPHCDDVLLGNERGEVTETCFSNLVYRLGGRLYTPPIDSGLLSGTLRQDILERGEVSERCLLWDELKECGELWCVNSVRGWRKGRLAEDLHKM
jgi:para-aminobenzoate synthetase/4-amino-4-deoxychorismate lyase